MEPNKNLHATIPSALLVEAQQVADADHISMDELVREAMERRLRERREISSAETPAKADRLSPEEWMRKYKAWGQRHAHENLPILSDEAISRESIYADRGL